MEVRTLHALDNRVPQGIIHHAVQLPPQKVLPPFSVGDLVRGVLPDLPDEQFSGVPGEPFPDFPHKAVGKLVHDVQPEPVCALCEPAVQHAPVPRDKILEILRIPHRGQGFDSPPAPVFSGKRKKFVPRKILRVPALKRPAIGIRPVAVEIPAVVPGVVEDAVQNNPYPTLVRGGDQPPEGGETTEPLVDLLVVPRVVLVVGDRLEHRRKVDDPHPQALEIVKLLGNPVQRPAEEIVV